MKYLFDYTIFWRPAPSSQGMDERFKTWMRHPHAVGTLLLAT